MDPIPHIEHYKGDEIGDVRDVKNKPPINNDLGEEVTYGNRSDNDNEDMIEDYKDEEQEPQIRRSYRIPKP